MTFPWGWAALSGQIKVFQREKILNQFSRLSVPSFFFFSFFGACFWWQLLPLAAEGACSAWTCWSGSFTSSNAKDLSEMNSSSLYFLKKSSHRARGWASWLHYCPIEEIQTNWAWSLCWKWSGWTSKGLLFELLVFICRADYRLLQAIIKNKETLGIFFFP